MAVHIEVDGLVAREVMNLSYSLHQEIDVEGRPSAVTRGGQIHLTVKSLNDGNTEFFEWVCDPYTTKNGTIKFEKRDGTPMKELKLIQIIMVLLICFSQIV